MYVSTCHGGAATGSPINSDDDEEIIKVGRSTEMMMTMKMNIMMAAGEKEARAERP